MAVEIPVVVDILGGIDDAIKTQLPKAMQNMQVALSKNALRLKFHVDDSNIGTLDTILKDTSLTADNLARALKDVNDQISKKVGGGAKFEGSNVSNKNQALLQARNALQQRYNVLLEIESANKRKQSDTIKDNTNNIKEENSELSKQGGILKNLTAALGGYLSLRTLVRFVKQIRDVTGELGYQRTALGYLLQDVEYGNDLFDRTVKAAKESPFRITQLVTYTKQLAAYRIEQENLFETTKRLADISAGLGVDMNRLILAFGQVRAASVLRGQELRQFTEAGIPLVDLLADKFTELKGEMVSTADVFKLISERAVPFSMISEIFEDLTDKGGQFYKMQERQAETLKGRWEKLKDAYDQALMGIGENDTFQRWNDVILNILTAVASNLRGIVKVINAASVGWVTYRIATSSASKSIVAFTVANARATKSMLKMGGVMGTLKSLTVLMRTEWKKFTAALSSNWVGLVLTGVATLITYFTTFRKKTEEVSSEMTSLENAIEKMSGANKAFSKADTLINRYERLASKTELTANENLKLSQTMNRLKEQFPDLIGVIGDENVKLEEQVRLLNDANEARKEEAKQDAIKELKLREKEYNDLLQSINAAQDDYNRKYEKFLKAQRGYDQGPVVENGRVISVTTEKAYSDADKAAIAAREHLDDLNSQAEKLLSKITRLRNQIDPSTAVAKWSEWQKQIKKVQDSMLGIGVTPVFTEPEIQEFTSIYELSGKLKKRIDDLTTSIKGMKSQLSNMTDTTSDSYKALSGEIAASEKTLEIAEAIRLSLGLVFGKGGSSSYTQDPFIKQMQDRIKFMQDFQKGYEDLSKYMSKAGALDKESDVMLTRGLSLGIDASEQKRAAEELSEWYKDMINQVFGKLQREKGVSGTLQDFLSRQITGNANRDKMLRDYQSLLQSLFDAQTDFDIAKEKQKLEDSLKKLSDEIKRSETARNFYKNILDLTGDEELAATMSVNVYGGIGEEFKERMQEQLNGALKSLKLDKTFRITDEIERAFNEMDFKKILDIKGLPEDVAKVIREAYESTQKYNDALIRDLLKTLESAKSYGEKQVKIAEESARRIASINSLDISDDAKKSLLEKNARKESEEVAKLQYEVFKDSPMYVELFANLDTASSRMLNNMRKNLIALKDQWKDLDPTQVKELQSRIDELDQQIASRNPFKAIITAIKEYRALTKEQSRKGADEEAIRLTDFAKAQEELLQAAKERYQATLSNKNASEEEIREAKDNLDLQSTITDLAIEQANQAQNTANSYRDASQRIAYAASRLQEWSGYVTESLNGVGEIVSTFASDDISDTFNIISEGISKTLGGATQLASSFARIMAGDLTAIPSLISGSGNLISGIFKTISDLTTKDLDRQIKTQQDHLDALDYSYDRLGKAMEKSFGSDYIYNYNKQLEILTAKQAAYNEQARLEREKGKKADEDKIKDYENSARDAADQIADMRTQLSEFFSGTDLTSAAEDFANAWIEAYKEFGSTTDAMSEKFNEMIENMINKSLAAKIMQEMLQPIFDQIDLLAKDGLLSTEDISSIAALAQERIPLINDAMTNLMTNLASAGLDVRNSTVGLKGISKEIAGASEESILALAAGINTQNFYMSYIPTISENVSAILAAMTGGVNPTTSVLTNENGDIIPSVQQMVYDHLPNVDNNISEMLRLFRSVVTTKNSSTNTAYIAIR